VLLRIDRHRAVVGAEHDAVGAEHLGRLAHMGRPEAHRVDVQELQIVARHLLAADDRVVRHPLAPEPVAEIEPAHAGQQSAAHMRHDDLQPRIAVEQAGQDHPRQSHCGIERPADQLIELELVHLLLVADGYARRMDEHRHLLVLRPFPERK
jgi:hypothetical protein